MEIVVPILLELLASELWERVKTRYRSPEPGWAQAAAQALAPKLGRPLTSSELRAVTRWLLRSDVFSSLAASTPQTAVADVERVVEALEFELGPPSDHNKALAAGIAAAVIVHVTEIVEPSTAAVLSTHRSLAATLAELMDGQAVIYDAVLEIQGGVEHLLSRHSSTDPPDLGRLPVSVARWVRRAHVAGTGTAIVVRWLGDPGRIRGNVDVLIEERPSWLSASGELWAAVAAAAEAHDLHGQAVASFERAAELLPDDRASLLARAALAAAAVSGRDAADQLLTRAAVGASPADLAYLGVVDAVIANDLPLVEQRAVAALQTAIPDEWSVRSWLGQALIARGDLDGAIDTFEAGLANAEDNAGYRILFAGALLQRALDNSGRTRVADAQRALDLAVDARDLRRRWGGVNVTRFLGHGVMTDRGLRGLGATCQRTQLG